MDADQKKLEHLKLIQTVIERIAQNSFLLKGCAVTLITALYTFAKDANAIHVLIGVLPCLLFWYLDGYFLSQERLYRWFYDRVRKSEHVNAGDFDLTPHYVQHPEPVLRAIFRRTILPFYVTIATATLTVWLISDDWMITAKILDQKLQ